MPGTNRTASQSEAAVMTRRSRNRIDSPLLGSGRSAAPDPEPTSVSRRWDHYESGDRFVPPGLVGNPEHQVHSGGHQKDDRQREPDAERGPPREPARRHSRGQPGGAEPDGVEHDLEEQGKGAVAHVEE